MVKTDICPSFGLCGGCCYQDLAYEEQLRIKKEEVRGYLEKNGIDPDLLIGIKPCPSIYEYRNKMEYTFGDQVKGGELHLGLHQAGHFMNIIDVSECRLVTEDYNTIVKAALDHVLEKGYTHYNKKSHSGLCRSLVIRRGVRTHELLLNIVTTSENGFNEEDFVNMILGLDLKDKVVGIIHTVNDSISDVVKCDELKLLYGRDHYEEEILGLKFRIRPFSFFQTNVEAAERLYSDAISLIKDIDNKTVFDLYCGTGTITQAMAKKAAKAIGVEIVEEAVETARESAEMNGLKNCTFIAEDVNTALSKIACMPDVIVIDPPRSGIVPKAMDQILSYGVDQIIYVSCNPKTMAINLKTAIDKGYVIDSITAYDNFPMTKHIETVASISKNRYF